MPLLDEVDRADPMLKGIGKAAPIEKFYDGTLGEEEYDEEPAGLDETRALQLLRTAESQANNLLVQMQTKWQRSLKAVRNEHFDGSKYLSPDYRLRSKTFIPRTRGALVKDLTATAGALFGTMDVASVDAQNEEDPENRATAAIIEEVLNYRLDRSTGLASIPWYQVVMGARHDVKTAGICCSMQTWRFRRKQTGTEPVYMDQDGEPSLADKAIYKIILDRPDVELFAAENVLIAPGTSWLRPAQEAPYIVLKMPMHAGDVVQMTSQQNKYIKWRPVSADDLKSYSQSKSDTTGVRAAREGRDRYQDGSSHEDDWSVVWVYITFMRVDGEDYVFWSCGSTHLLSDPQLVEEVFPEQGGERPICIGVDMIEPHKLYPMSGVEALQPLQQEINDLRNLRLDATKQAVNPVKSVLRGRQVDLKNLHSYGPGAVRMVTQHEDVQEVESRGPHPSAFNEMQFLNVDFDDAAGQMNAGTVQTQRSLNETVGGMRLLAGSANAVSEFFLRNFVETWVEPVLGQIVKLLQYYEADETILALAGQKAGLWKQFGVDTITDSLLTKQVMTRVNVGIGSSDPQLKLQKFEMAARIAGQIITPGIESGEISLEYEEIIAEVFGAAGYKDAGERFFKFQQPNPQQGDPAMQAEMAKLELEKQKMQQEAQLKREEMAMEQQLAVEKMKIEAQTKIEIAKMQAQLGAAQEQRAMAMSAAGDERQRQYDAMAEDRRSAYEQRNADRQHEFQKQQADRDHELKAKPQPSPVSITADGAMSEVVSGIAQSNEALRSSVEQQSQVMGQAVQAIGQVAERLGEAATNMTQAAQVMSRPKKIKRNPTTNEIEGVE